MADAQQATTRATVHTDRPQRYGKQLVSHLGRRNGGEWSAADGTGWIDLSSGRVALTTHEDELIMEIHAATDDLPQLEDVVARHLVRFGEKNDLTVSWTRDPLD